MKIKVTVSNVVDNKTFKAVSTTYKKHSRYNKYIVVHRKYLADSCGKEVKVGDEVEISTSRPLSKSKKWALCS